MISLSDPRFKHNFLQDVATVEDIVLKEVNDLVQEDNIVTPNIGKTTTASDTETKHKSKGLGALLRKYTKESNTFSMGYTPNVDQAVKSEIVIYKSLPFEDVDGNPLEWWKTNHRQFPLLSKLVKKYLCIPASSVSSERMFSSGGNTVTPLHNRLDPENVNMLVFLSRNLK
ncbi:zinc finger BED domain-containing protein 1-like [Acipenser oxyrinchus oxyrinchus]|uniref:Zinc finger BED domain-containing protein 1-like n=1 Tax=Acipenser oxyrinchus oxyrinchus TaxID=40147 RepID=A0AAD8GDU5_ACIOX|nr:zinc finger BED domain-containing protein 1-like [Acipenser oxyrinchus oxyrinchus]